MFDLIHSSSNSLVVCVGCVVRNQSKALIEGEVERICSLYLWEMLCNTSCWCFITLHTFQPPVSFCCTRVDNPADSQRDFMSVLLSWNDIYWSIRAQRQPEQTAEMGRLLLLLFLFYLMLTIAGKGLFWVFKQSLKVRVSPKKPLQWTAL